MRLLNWRVVRNSTFGGGVWGKRIYHFLRCIGKNIDGFIDNRKSEVIDGYNVYHGSEIQDWELGTYYIVISSGREEGIRCIKKQLMQIGLKETRDFYIFNKFIEYRKGTEEIKDYLFGYTRDYCGERGFKKFVSKQVNSRTKRILVFGGSTSDPGYNTTIVNWTEWLVRILEEKGCIVEVLTGGIQGYSSTQDLFKLIRDGIWLRPDLVIAYSGINDATGMGVINEHPAVMESVKHLIKDEYSVYFGMANNERPSSIWLMNIKMMAAICSVFDILFWGILEPFPFLDAINVNDEFCKNFFPQNIQERIVTFYKEVREKIKDEKQIIDLSDVLIEKQENVYDYVHCDTEGNRFIAENIAECIKQYLSEEK